MSSTESKEKKNNNGSGGSNTNNPKKNNQNKKQNKKFDYAERVMTLYPPGAKSTGNAGQWLDHHLTVLRGKFGKMVGDLSVTNKFEREEPEQPNNVDLEDDPYGLKKAKAIKKFELFWRLQQEDEQKFEQMYSMLWGAMSTASQQLLRDQAEFSDVEMSCDPHRLVQLVKSTHMCVDVYSKPEIKKHNLMSCSCRSQSVIDEHVDHILTCKQFNGSIKSRHDLVVREIKSLCHHAGLQWTDCYIGQLRTVSHVNGDTPDGYILGLSGRPFFIDVTIAHPTGATHMRNGSTRHKHFALNSLEANKIAKFERRCHEFDSDFVPLALETYGGTSEKF